MEGSTKTCGMCQMEIPATARKCRYCQHYQSRTWRVVYHPAFAAAFLMLPMFVMLLAISSILDSGEAFGDFRDQIKITNSELTFGETQSGPTIAVIGTVQNNSSIPWKEVTFHSDFFDAAGKRIDVKQEEQYSFVVPSQEEISFKISFRREFPEPDYARHTVRVVSAKDGRNRF